MANLNKVMLIGRLTRDPEVRTFSTGGKVAAFGFAVNNRRKNATTGQWEDEPVFLDLEAFNRGDQGRQLADQVEQYFKKGRQVFIEGHLRLDQWTSQDGQKRQRIKIVVENYQLLEPREGWNAEGGSRFSRENPAAPRTQPAATASYGSDFSEPEPMGQADGPSGDGIPF
jgi:single-strand DNA-binding protein